MQHECRITVPETKCFPDLQEKYLADPKSGPCPFFKPGDTFLLRRTPRQDDFYHLMNGKFCGEAWDAVVCHTDFVFRHQQLSETGFAVLTIRKDRGIMVQIIGGQYAAA